MVAGRLTHSVPDLTPRPNIRGVFFSGATLNLDTIVTTVIIQPTRKPGFWQTVIWKAPDGCLPARKLASRRRIHPANSGPGAALPPDPYPSLHKGDAIRPIESQPQI